MFINQIDELFDNILNKFFDFLIKKDSFNKFNKDSNFVKYQGEILITIKDFINTLDKAYILKIVKKENYLDDIFNIIKRYCAFYIYLGIAYYYKQGRDLFITNIIETSKNQKDTKIQIQNFFNSDNNSKIINFFIDIQNIKSLIEFKTMDKIKIILLNNPIKFNTTIKLFNELGEDYIINNFLIKDNFHNILKTIIFRQIYLKEEKIEINKLLNEVDKDLAEYKYIEIIVANINKIVDFNIIQKFLTIKQLKSGLAEEIYNYLEEMQTVDDIIIKENQDFINYLFSNKILIPITEEFIRYHKDSEKYDVESDNKNRDDTKIKYIVNKMNNIRNYYSPITEKNQKLKLEIDKYFYRNLDPRMAILYNDNEEIKIIQKLLFSENASDFDLLIDLENIRKYAYVNFKNVSRDYIKLRTPVAIEAIRYTNLKKKNTELLETRIGHNNIDLNVVGVAFNPTRLNISKNKNMTRRLDCYTKGNLINVTDITKKDNGFLSFIKVMESTVNKNNKNNKNLYYWMFNNLKDIPKLNKYIDYNKHESEKNFKIMLSEIYQIWINLVKDKFEKYISKKKSINVWELEYLFNIYKKKYFNFNLTKDIKNSLINSTLINKLIELPITEDETDNIIPGKRDVIIELPKLNIKIDKKNIIVISQTKHVEEIENNINIGNAVCNHYIKWGKINKSGKTDKEDLNQIVFEFVKQYVKVNERGDYICKSCNEVLAIHKFVYEGTYNKEQDQFMTTSLAVTQKLHELPKYMGLNRTITNIGKNLEKIAYMADITYYLGNDLAMKLHRKTVTKDTIDLILLHTSYLKNQLKDRITQAGVKYNINKDYTNLFFFELKDEIFLTSSTDTDYYKIIKYNNVISYLILIIITELNSGQILNLRDDKRCNYFLYSKIGQSLFKDLYLRVNQTEKILVNNIPLLAYCIFYFSCLLTNNRIWLWATKEDNKDNFNINIQKTIIHTVIDLINTIIEANLEKEKNYLYEILATRFTIKIKHVFSDTNLLSRINDKINKKVSITQDNKISFISKKSIYLPLNISGEFITGPNKKYCEISTKVLNKVKFKPDANKMDLLTNCDDGQFHQWIFSGGNLVCKLCKKEYYDILKDTKTTTESDTNINYFDKIKLTYTKKLTKRYCLTGTTHQIDPATGICKICKINPETYNYTNKELKQLEDYFKNKEIKDANDNFKSIHEKELLLKKTKEINNKILSKFDSRFEANIVNNYSSNKLENYIIDFIERIIKILGVKIKIKNKTTYLKDTLYILDHDYLGNDLKQNINILTSDNLIQTIQNHHAFNRDVLYYKDKAHKVYVYYDIVTLQYLGYSEDNKNIKKNKNNASIKIEYSIKDMLLILGLENMYTSLYHLDSSLINNFTPDNNKIINNLIRTRVINLKQIIARVQSIINSIRNHGKVNRFYNVEEKDIVNEFITKLKNFNLKDENQSNSVFKHSKYILSLVNVKPIYGNINLVYNNQYLDNNILNTSINADTKLIYFLVMNLNRLLDYNTLPAIESELAYLIIRIIEYSFKIYYKEHNYFEIRKFDYLLLSDIPYINETVRLDGFYQELVTSQEIDDEKVKEQNYDAQEAFDSLDIDDYDQDDDIDGNMEALDGDIDT
uniref:Uncharacterized protein n=1 Tax=viral metagenome TaxID=1070528 RepID=A0A6C0DA89_9ZZZZ